MRLSAILNEDEIKIDLDAEDKMEAIEELVDHLISDHEISLRDRDTILDIVFQRERSISTGIGGGVAIPHGSLDCVDDIVGAIGISSKGIDFDAFDGAPVYIVLLLLVPKNQFGKHIKTLAQIARILSHADVRNSIRSARSEHEVIRIIEKAEREHIT